jgi:hypothetical protein
LWNNVPWKFASFWLSYPLQVENYTTIEFDPAYFPCFDPSPHPEQNVVGAPSVPPIAKGGEVSVPQVDSRPLSLSFLFFDDTILIDVSVLEASIDNGRI